MSEFDRVKRILARLLDLHEKNSVGSEFDRGYLAAVQTMGQAFVNGEDWNGESVP